MISQIGLLLYGHIYTKSQLDYCLDAGTNGDLRPSMSLSLSTKKRHFYFFGFFPQKDSKTTLVNKIVSNQISY